jgi:hypothetical protein
MKNMNNVGIPLTPAVARRIIAKLFEQKPTWRRDALITEVKRVHSDSGGTAGSQEVSAVVTKALGQLREDGLIQNQAYGLWTLVSSNDVSAVKEPASLISAEVLSQEDSITIAEKEIGTGDESIYVYFNPNDRKLADLEGRKVWECKIGRTGSSEVLTRIRNQGTVTALSHPPVIGLIIRTHDSAALERALHSALRLIDAGVSDSPGAEWFITSPEHIAEWFAQFETGLAKLKPDSNESSRRTSAWNGLAMSGLLC